MFYFLNISIFKTAQETVVTIKMLDDYKQFSLSLHKYTTISLFFIKNFLHFRCHTSKTLWQNFVQDKSRQFLDSLPCAAKTKEPLKTKGSGAETEGFEPSYRDEPINAFRVRRVTAASLRLQDVCLFKKGRLHIIIHIFSDLYREITK